MFSSNQDAAYLTVELNSRKEGTRLVDMEVRSDDVEVGPRGCRWGLNRHGVLGPPWKARGDLKCR